MKTGIGIDTGGTYTDVALYDFETGEVLGKAKSPTTKRDLTQGISRALKKLPADQLPKADVVSLSTTLATNAVVENVGGRVGLILIGVNEKLLERVGAEYGLPPTREILLVDAELTMSGEVLKEPDWEAFEQQAKSWCEGKQAVAIVQFGARSTGAQMEKRAREIVAGLSGLPAVCGHELHTDLNMMRRAASAFLNARLLPVIDNFLYAIRLSLKSFSIDAPVVIVRSDGTLMSEEFAARRPVETLLCGPAASVMFGAEIANSKNSLLVDMGGTTSDIAMVEDGVPVRAAEGVDIGRWKTFVKGMYIKTFGLGGDSAVRCVNGRGLTLGPGRLVPLSMLAVEHPEIKKELRRIAAENLSHTIMLHEFFLLAKEPDKHTEYNAFEQQFVERLKDGPLSMQQAADCAGLDLYGHATERLENEGVVLRAGFTPTDAMHLKGDFSSYDKKAAQLGAECLAQRADIASDELPKRVYELAKKKLYVSFVEMMMQQSGGMEITREIEQHIALAWDATQGRDTGFARPLYQTDATLVGLGAPIHIFLKDVADALGTTAIIPEHADVANAIGALVGRVSCKYEIHITHVLSEVGESTYMVHGVSGTSEYDSLKEALGQAKKEAEAEAAAEAKRRGARHDLALDTEVVHQEAEDASGTEIFFGSVVTAQATGKISV